MKNKTNHQNHVICFRKIYNRMGDRDCQKNVKKPIDDGSTVDARPPQNQLEMGWS